MLHSLSDGASVFPFFPAFLKVQCTVLMTESLYASLSIGKHLRHARDHFSLLLDSVDAQTGNVVNELCYDVRSRGTPMETSRSSAKDALEECVERLERVVPKTKKDDEVVLNAVTPHMQTFRTTFGREVSFSFFLLDVEP